MSTEGIILAAGLSSRISLYKPLLELSGKTIIEHCLNAMYDICSKIIVVVGYNHEKLSPVLDKYSKVEQVLNSNFKAGMYSSIITGYKHTTGSKVFMTPCDYPFITRDVYESLLKVEEGIVIPAFNGQKGHPLLMDRSYVRLLLSAKKLDNLRKFIFSHNFSTVEAECPGVLLDIDTYEDYECAKIICKTFKRLKADK